MLVKGTAVLARREFIVRAFGQQRWDAFIATQGPSFQRPLATDRFEMADYVRFQDGILKQFYGGDRNALFTMGEQSAEWALREGPYKVFLTGKDVARFAATVLPAVWRAYYSEGSAAAELRDRVVHVRIVGAGAVHPYIELASTGFFKRALEIVSGKTVRARTITPAGPGVTEMDYQYTILG